MIDKDYILSRVSKGLECQFEIYSWDNMIDDLDLTKKEKEFAKNNIGYKAYIIE